VKEDDAPVEAVDTAFKPKGPAKKGKPAPKIEEMKAETPPIDERRMSSSPPFPPPFSGTSPLATLFEAALRPIAFVHVFGSLNDESLNHIAPPRIDGNVVVGNCLGASDVVSALTHATTAVCEYLSAARAERQSVEVPPQDDSSPAADKKTGRNVALRSCRLHHPSFSAGSASD